jgi:hypothetical protein
MTSAAIELCRRFETELISAGFEPGSADLKAALAGTASNRSILWYECNSELGAITFREAEELRSATDIACFLVALGGVKALERMPGRPTFRTAIQMWVDHDEPAPAKPAIVPRIDAMRDGAAEMAMVFGAQSRTNLGVWEKPEYRFDAYAFAVFSLVIYLLFHL